MRSLSPCMGLYVIIYINNKMNTLPNEYEPQYESSKRISSNSKRKTFNRIQIYSKVTHDQNQNLHPNPTLKSQQLLRIEDEKIPLKKMVSQQLQPQQHHPNFHQFIQELLQINRKIYEDKFNEKLKLNHHEISKLQNIINMNTQLLKQKDKQITEMSKMLRETVNQNAQHLHKKIHDCQIKLNALAQNQQKLRESMHRTNNQIQKIEKGFLRLFACKQASLSQKINLYIHNVNQKVSDLHETQEKNMKKLAPKEDPKLAYNVKVISDNLSILKNQVKNVKIKQFKYQNEQLKTLQQQLASLTALTNTLDKRFIQRTPKSVKKVQKHQCNEWSISQFSDYEKAYDEADSVDEDKFFHETSKLQPFNGNDSFQNFTSEEEDEQTTNERRLISCVRQKQMKTPLSVKIDSTGMLMLAKEGIYLIDNNMHGFRLTQLELRRLQVNGFIVL